MSDFLRILPAVAPPPPPPPPPPPSAPPRPGAPAAPLPPRRGGAGAAAPAEVSLMAGARQLESNGSGGVVVPVLQERGQGGEGGGAGRDGGGGGDSPDASGGGVEVLDFRVRAIGDAVAMVCRFESTQVVWSARIPLDPGLLPESVLFLDYSPGVLELRFQTSRWDVRELLESQLALLVEAVKGLLPAGFFVGISV